MQQVTFTQLTIDDLRSIFREELERYHEQRAARQDDTPGPAGASYVSKKEAARLLSCSAGTVDNLARAGRLTRHYIGKKAVRFSRAQVLEIAQKGNR